MCPVTPCADPGHHHRLHFEPTGGATPVGDGVAAVRRALADWHLDVSGEAVDDAALVAAELVGNAVRHAGGPRQLDLEHRGNRLTIAVTDSSRARPRPRPHQADGVGGHGLFVVDRLAVRWGHDPQEQGKTVWAEMLLQSGR
ncbi:ATP-binding protein [Kitasatospora sp. NBC_01539]|uniref:ATP-binding protein n=1 Tax=Kitasatospora sp. NBC_01539 TaxID=2903577 RepID=UPI0038602B82